MMKRFLSLLLALLALTACVSAGAIANPVREVYDDDDFEDILNIEIDDDELYTKDYTMSIINNEIGQIAFTVPNVEGNPVAFTLRFTRKAELDGDKELFAGVYATDWEEFDPIDYNYVEEDDDDHDDDVTVSVKSAYSASEKTTLYFWNHKGVYYELTVNGDISQMQLAEVLDSVMTCCFD